MYKYFVLILVALAFVSCKKDSSTPTDNNATDYFVKWTFDGQQYNVSQATGSYFRNSTSDPYTLTITGSDLASGNVFPRLTITVDNANDNGDHKWSKDNNDVIVVWSISQTDYWTLINGASQCFGTVTISQISNTYVSGSFTAKIAHLSTAPNYDYKTLTGTFKVPRAN